MIRTLIISLTCLAASTVLAQGKPKPPAVKKPALRDELLKRIKPDQKARLELIKWMKKNQPAGGGNVKLQGAKMAEFSKLVGQLKKIDAENTAWLKKVVDKQGWPTTSMVGKTGSRAAWLLVQHADADRKFQRRCLDLMTKLPKGEVSLSNVAYLTDRVLLAEGKKQKYGTQFHQVKGKFEPKPLEDPANVDKFRAEAGLPPLAEYKKLIRKQYAAGAKKQQPKSKP